MVNLPSLLRGAALGALLCAGCSASEPGRTLSPAPSGRTAGAAAGSSRSQDPGTAAESGPAARDGGAANAEAAPLRPLAPATVARFDAVVQGAMKRGEIPGAVVVVLRDGRVVLRKAYGFRRVEPTREPMTADTLFDLASLTKPVATATAVLMLVEQGKLRLSDPVARHLPAFAAHAKGAVTVEQLVSHTSGLPAGLSLSKHHGARAAAIDAVLRVAPRHPPGRTRLYSDLGYIVLGALVEELAGVSLDQFVAKHLASPLGMTATGYRPSPALAARAAPTERRRGKWLRGAVHDPTAEQLGGVAGHAGLFTTADDLARFARMMLGGGALEGRRVLRASSVQALTELRPSAGSARPLAWAPVAGGVAHTGFTGTYLWMDLQSGTALVALSSRLHPHGTGDATRLRRELVSVLRHAEPSAAKPGTPGGPSATRLGVDQLVAERYRSLQGRQVGLLTNHTGIASDGRRTIDLLHAASTVRLVALFSPEHGIRGRADGAVQSGRDPKTGLVIHSLYGRHKRPTQAQLRGIDTLVFDIQDAGCRFYTYISTLGYLLEAAAQHRLKVVVLDRPNPLDGVTVEGPVLDPGRESFIGYHRIPVRHGMTVGELAQLFNAERRLGVDLQVVQMKGWQRARRFDQTGVGWRPTSPNLRTLDAALLYPGLGLLEASNLSVGRGTDRPFGQIGAPWLDGAALSAALAAAKLPGVQVRAVEFTPSASVFAGQRCRGVAFELTDRDRFRSVRTGIELAVVLRRLHRAKWKAHRVDLLLGHQRSLDALLAGRSTEQISALWQSELKAFAARRQRHLLY